METGNVFCKGGDMRRLMMVMILCSVWVQNVVCSSQEASAASKRRSNPRMSDRRNAIAAADTPWGRVLSDSSCDESSRSGCEECSSIQYLQVPAVAIKRRAGATRTPWQSAMSESDSIDPQRGFGRPLVVVSDDEVSRDGMTPALSGSRSSSSTEQPSHKGAEIDTFIAEQLSGLEAHLKVLKSAVNAQQSRRSSVPDSGAGVGVGRARVPWRGRREYEEYVCATGSNSEEDERTGAVVARRRYCCKRPNKVGPA